MSFSALHRYAHTIFAQVPWPHWVVMGMLSLALIVIPLFRKRHSVYGTFCLGLAVFIGLFLLDATVLSRLSDTAHHENRFSLAAEYHRLIHSDAVRWTEMLANVVAFVPLGLCLSEFMASTKRFSTGRRLWLSTLGGFSLSLCIECLQLLLQVGYFELTDLVMNTIGAFFGAGAALLIRGTSSLVAMRTK